MRLNERDLIWPKDERAVKIATMNLAPADLRPIYFLLLPGIGYTWRGEGQKIPHGAQIVGNGKIFSTDDGIGRYIHGTLVDGLAWMHGMDFLNWEQPDFLEDHRVILPERPLAAWFAKPDR